MKRKRKCFFWPVVDTFLEKGTKKSLEELVGKHLEDCQSCRQRFDQERRISLLLADLFVEYREVEVPVVNLEPQTVRIERRGFGWLDFPKKPVWVTAGLLASFFLIYFSFFRSGQPNRPAAVSEKPGCLETKSEQPASPHPSLSPTRERIKVRGKGDKMFTQQEETGSAGEGAAFWVWFDRGVSLVGFPQEVRALSQSPGPDWTDKSR